MTSEPERAFVWIWLPGASEPVVAGRLDPEGEVLTFTYGRSYLARADRVPLYLPELPLERGALPPLAGELAGCIADGAPDAWGKRVILNRLTGRRADADVTDLTPLTYLLESGSDRTGALDFQRSAVDYAPRSLDAATLAELAESAELVERGLPLPPALDEALLHGSSIGGARPKARLRDGKRELIAKFSSTTDTYPVVKGEFLAMTLAQRAGIETAPVELTKAMKKEVLLVDRFDRPGDGSRRAMVSALTILGLDEIGGRYASYADLADMVRARFDDSTATLRELFARITFNVLCGNTDDHARNHAAFWDGTALALTPAYDICPGPRSGGEATQAMAIGRDGFRFSQVAGCVDRSSIYLLSKAEAREVVDHQIDVIETQWAEACDLAELTAVQRNGFWRRQFLNPFATEGY
ncbi:MAG TPA: HipA domain-containing protein [Solirubrobacterales bacterium]|nr:HipA domain-containing protein [Solirubrobacterales bacterium]